MRYTKYSGHPELSIRLLIGQVDVPVSVPIGAEDVVIEQPVVERVSLAEHGLAIARHSHGLVLSGLVSHNMKGVNTN